MHTEQIQFNGKTYDVLPISPDDDPWLCRGCDAEPDIYLCGDLNQIRRCDKDQTKHMIFKESK